MTTLTWKWSNGFYFAHAKEGMWAIEQSRGKFILTLDLAGAHRSGIRQDMGTFTSSRLTKREAQKAHRIFERAEAAALKEAKSPKRRSPVNTTPEKP